ncbi:MAG: hypothetical protein A3B96_03165 [Candidatus Spechtbacteria bacterium RIFCSPHIGHO2_02_FULL_43_15b]|uniref:Histidine--tRNA ligase n=1 Tax=Candidatus Spechtbacteria bacterium RIFCSPHIGHO2_01_FULL_43_30 TaxID=1802158 RepID=A0A1G2H8E6_9BACT|nr:MAG: hypothetical protein A2827_00485 [Candidatus Spechtbacteria bacterium RIFCSPHIGHO2_01_FULL_43_30]OGZ59744.1 MAG: hypothetical protein A3B96_03165 [Candidatus Spechtbacteria bacterium RIFCSPHIGHO2_02_FULL_43_15b]
MSKAKYQNVTGMPDTLPKDRKIFEMVENACFKLASYYDYERIDTPVIEYSELFEKGTGVTSDIVEKQMYSFKSLGGDPLTLRPEFTPSIVRSFIQHGMASWSQPVKLSTYGSVFRHERPQSGRLREFRQFEIDAIGELEPALDAQVIFVFYKIFQSLGIKDLRIEINSIGCLKCKPTYRRVLREYYNGRERSVCKDCRQRIKTNLLRVLDCKDEKCERLKAGAPEIVDYLCQECHSHLKDVLEILDFLEVPYALSSHLVRGLDYYTKTVFEIFSVLSEPGGAKKSQNEERNKDGGALRSDGLEERATAIAGGGRFDELVKLFGGEEAPAIGGAIGVDRTVAVIKKLGLKLTKERVPHVFFVHLGDLAKKRGLKVMEEFRSSGILVRESFGKSSIKAQMELADKIGVEYALILGHQEVAEDTIIIRDMKSGSQEVVPMGKVIKEIKKRLRKV